MALWRCSHTRKDLTYSFSHEDPQCTEDNQNERCLGHAKEWAFNSCTEVAGTLLQDARGQIREIDAGELEDSD